MLHAGVTALSLLITPFLMQASNKWLLLADPEAGTLVSSNRFLFSCCHVQPALLIINAILVSMAC